MYIFFVQVSQFKNGELLRVKMESNETIKKELQKKKSEVSYFHLDGYCIVNFCSAGAAISRKG